MNALRMADNLEAPSRGIRNADGMYIPRSQMGAIDVWHGSPHKFERFTAMDNIGGGEGAQAYGHGGYHASNPDVAVGYKNTLSKDTFLSPTGAVFSKNRLIDLGFDKSDAAIIMAAIKNSGGDFNEAAKLVNRPSVAKFLIGIGDGGSLNEGSLYRNQLRWPDAAREASDPLSDKHFLDWDKPLSEQSPEVQRAISKVAPEFEPTQLSNGKFGVKRTMPDGTKKNIVKIQEDTPELAMSKVTGERLYDIIANGTRDKPAASVALNQLGIPGIRYLDAGSRGAGQGTSNYVTFSDDLVNILERNGVPVTAPQPGLKK
jgi:hypothetical protein